MELLVIINSKSNSATADVDGKWRIEMPAMKAPSEPLEITVKGNNTILIKDVLIGEVWIAQYRAAKEIPGMD